MTNPIAPSGSLQLFADYGSDDDEEKVEGDDEQVGREGDLEAAAPEAVQDDELTAKEPSTRPKSSSPFEGDSYVQQRPAFYEDGGDSRDEPTKPPAANRQRSASSSGGLNFDISDDEGGLADRHGDDDSNASNETGASGTRKEGKKRKLSQSDGTAAPAAKKSSSSGKAPRLPKVSSLVNYGLEPYESGGSDNEAGASAGEDEVEEEEEEEAEARDSEVVGDEEEDQDGAIGDGVSSDQRSDKSEKTRDNAPEKSFEEEDAEQQAVAGTAATDEDNAAGKDELMEPPPPKPKNCDEHVHETVHAKALTDADRTAAREKADQLLISLSGSGTTGLTLPPPPSAPPSKNAKIKVESLILRRNKMGINLMHKVFNNKQYRNPSIYEKVIGYHSIDDRGTNFSPGVFDPYIWDKHSYYDALLRTQLEAEKKRVVSAGRTAAHGVSGEHLHGRGGGPQPLMQVAARKPGQHAQAADAVSSAGLAADSGSGRKSKWDTAPKSGVAGAAPSGTVGAFIRRKI